MNSKHETLFRQLAERIATKLTRYWDTYRQPLAARVLVPQALAQIPKRSREAFKLFLTEKKYMRTELSRSGGTYCFPCSDKIDDEMIQQAMLDFETRRTKPRKRDYDRSLGSGT